MIKNCYNSFPVHLGFLKECLTHIVQITRLYGSLSNHSYIFGGFSVKRLDKYDL